MRKKWLKLAFFQKFTNKRKETINGREREKKPPRSTRLIRRLSLIKDNWYNHQEKRAWCDYKGWACYGMEKVQKEELGLLGAYFPSNSSFGPSSPSMVCYYSLSNSKSPKPIVEQHEFLIPLRMPWLIIQIVVLFLRLKGEQNLLFKGNHIFIYIYIYIYSHEKDRDKIRIRGVE